MKLVDRLTWHAMRTPIAGGIKAVRRAMHAPMLRERKRLADGLGSDPVLAGLARDLNRDGYVDVSDAISPAAVNALLSAAESKLDRVADARELQASTRKAFWVRMLDEDMEDGLLPSDNCFVSPALDPAVIGVLASALGELPQLDYVLVTFSEGSDAPLTSSQLWHRDYDDTRTIKLFVYLTDVTEVADGPFTFLPAPVSDRVGFTRRTHRADGAVFTGGIIRDDIKEMTGARGRAFLVETSRCLHMGSRVLPGHARLLYTATFTTAPRLYSPAPPAFRLTGDEDAVTRCVLEPRSVAVRLEDAA